MSTSWLASSVRWYFSTFWSAAWPRLPGTLTVLFTGSWRNFTMMSLHSLPSRYSMKSLAVLGAGAFFMMPLGEIIKIAPSSG